MVKPGDTVRYLNDVGGGIVTRVEGKIAYVEDGGFENPVLASDLVVVLPAGHQPNVRGAKLMFDQAARDAAVTRKEEPAKKAAEAPEPAQKPKPAATPETDYGDRLNIALAFEPSSTRNLAEATFNAVLVNDSNYYLDFTFAGRDAEARAWSLIFQGTVAPNELIDLQQYTHADLPSIERIALQAVAYKEGKPFELKPVVNITRRLDLTKFHKLHCFRPGIYFEDPVIELQLIKDDVEPRQTIASAIGAKDDAARRLAEKYRVDAPQKKKKPNPADNPNRLLPPIEVDLHIDQLVDTTAGMDNAAMLTLQLDKVRSVMKANSRRIGQKVIFIHGKGEGVLRKEVLNLLRREYPKATTQDASFREYGFGATLVTIH